MKKYYDRANHRLVFISQAADSSCWDNHWQTPDLEQAIKQKSESNYYTRVTKRFLTPTRSIKVLDGGCGRGEVVYALRQAGYDAYGIDYAVGTVKEINRLMPDLKIAYGHVDQLNFPDNYFNGYWSLGVIEHAWDGYQAIIKEASRVLKPNGYLFITYPYLSALRQIKTALHVYPHFQQNQKPKNFYQFVLPQKTVSRDLQQAGFKARYQRPLDGFKGLKDEVTLLQPLFSRINSSPTRVAHYLRVIIGELAAPFCGHVILQVWQKS